MYPTQALSKDEAVNYVANVNLAKVDSTKFIVYHAGMVPREAFGLRNVGNLCWFNGLFQALLSLPSFNGAMLALYNDFRANKSDVGVLYNQLLFSCVSAPIIYRVVDPMINDPHVPRMEMSAMLAAKFTECALAAKKTISEFNSQEGVANSFCLFLEILRDNRIYRVFNSKYNRKIVCPKCHVETSNIDDKSPIMNLYDIKNTRTQVDFEDFVRIHSSVTRGYKCEKCGKVSDTVERIEQLKMLREIITIVFNKYAATSSKHEVGPKTTIWYPEYLTFPTVDGGKLIYRLCAQVCHYGSFSLNGSGGHIAGQFLRGDGKWYAINDSSVRELDDYSPTDDAYVIFYNLYKKE